MILFIDNQEHHSLPVCKTSRFQPNNPTQSRWSMALVNQTPEPWVWLNTLHFFFTYKHICVKIQGVGLEVFWRIFPLWVTWHQLSFNTLGDTRSNRWAVGRKGAVVAAKCAPRTNLGTIYAEERLAACHSAPSAWWVDFLFSFLFFLFSRQGFSM